MVTQPVTYADSRQVGGRSFLHSTGPSSYFWIPDITPLSLVLVISYLQNDIDEEINKLWWNIKCVAYNIIYNEMTLMKYQADSY